METDNTSSSNDNNNRTTATDRSSSPPSAAAARGAGDSSDTVTCPLCQEGFKDKETLEDHAMSIHSINSEGLARLMMLMQGSHWLNSNKNAKEDEETSGRYIANIIKGGGG